MLRRVMTLRQRIYEVILPDLDIGIVEFCERADVSRQALNKAFRREDDTGWHSIDTGTAEKIAVASGRTVPWVLVGDAFDSADTLALAGVAAAEISRDFPEIPADDAWLAMRGIRLAKPSVHEFFRAGLQKLKQRPHFARTPDLEEEARVVFRSSAPPGTLEGKKPSRS
jgi:hypothetical protein